MQDNVNEDWQVLDNFQVYNSKCINKYPKRRKKHCWQHSWGVTGKDVDKDTDEDEGDADSDSNGGKQGARKKEREDLTSKCNTNT